MGARAGDRVVVLGGSMGGLLAARVLSESFAEVLLVDRDALLGVSGPRRGVPHGRHAHGLVARGHEILESQFPGLTAELEAAGVRPGDFNGDIRWYFNGQRVKPAHSGLLSVPATRPVLEHHLRERVRAIPNVRFLERHDILGLATTPGGGRVLGARVQPQGGGGDPLVLDADLVVDTTGRGSRTPVWLEELGYGRPEEDRVKIDLAYTTRHYRVDVDPFGSDLAMIPAATPAHPRGAFYYRLPGNDGLLELSLTGILGDHPPTDPDGFLEFVRSLPIPDIYLSVRDAEPVDDPVMFKYPVSVWRHYERLTRFPERLLVMGDAVCSFNPIYAQGMTVAALESLVLRRHLSEGSLPDPRAFFRDIAREIASPWELSAGADLGYAGVEGRRTPKVRLINAYVSRLQRAAVHDSALGNAFIRVAGLIDPPQALLRPGTVLRVLRHGGRAPEPAVATEPAAQPVDQLAAQPVAQPVAQPDVPSGQDGTRSASPASTASTAGRGA
ncbi:FAD-binding monooxygenase [Microbispora corallina]|uniref:FAD-binding monooxygenase n=1 Tax=Microbispora corallina TaxID=83302 RepID=A0ABQ4FYU0_9ACTN|nr:FAD-binding monooxygenase [Microbispora corallina]GIH39985.1 FAD-binding monooxygenase [Microbispora corallina]